MKKLADIGHEMWIEDSYKDDKEDAYLIAHTAGSLLRCDNVRGAGAKVIVLDEKERRELVRQLLFMFSKDWIYPEDAWPAIEKAAMSQIEGLIKEQGL